MLAPFTRMSGEVFSLPKEDIDTDQIIPARFLTSTDRKGFGDAAFYDWRFHGDGTPKQDDPFGGAISISGKVLVTGNNFGCGSSREHAPWALREFGCSVIISTKIADIFRENALKNGLLTIEIEEAFHRKLMKQDGMVIDVDLEHQTICISGDQYIFSVDPFARRCLLEGTNALGILLKALPETIAFEQEHGR